MLALLWEVEVLLREIREIRLWHHVVLLLALHDKILCSLLSEAMVGIITTTSVSLSLRVGLRRVLLVGDLRLDLSIRKVHMVLRRGHLRQIVVDLNIRRHGRRLAHRLRLRIPRKLGNLQRGELFLPALKIVSIHSSSQDVMCKKSDANEPSHDEAMPCWAGMGLAWRGSELRRGYKSDPNTEGAPDLRNRPATPPRFWPPIHPKSGGNVAATEAKRKRWQMQPVMKWTESAVVMRENRGGRKE